MRSFKSNKITRMNTRMNHALRLSLLCCSLVTSCALAQQSAAQSVAQSVAQATPTTTFRYESNDDGHTISLTVKNGVVSSALIDGEEISSDRVKRVKGGYDILGEDGAVVAHIAQADSGGREAADGDAPRVRIQRATEQSMDDDAALKSAQAMARMQTVADNGQRALDAALKSAQATARMDAQLALARARVLQLEAGLARNAVGKDFTERVRVELVDATPPKSMIGVGLGEVDEALAHHLAIDPAKATLVTFVMDELPAKTAGIERFDVIVAINGDANASPTALRDVLKDIEPGAMIAFDVRRGADVKKIEVAAVVFDPTKMAAIDPQSFDFDMREVSGFELPNGAMAFEDRGGEMDGEMEPGAVGEENVVIFMGPDGKPRELRMPNFQRVPELPAIPRAAAQPRPLNRPQDDDRIRRLEEQMERLLRELEKMNERNAAAPTR